MAGLGYPEAGIPRQWEMASMLSCEGWGSGTPCALGAVYMYLVNACTSMCVCEMDGCMLCVRACLCAAGGFYADEGKRVKSEE